MWTGSATCWGCVTNLTERKYPRALLPSVTPATLPGNYNVLSLTEMFVKSVLFKCFIKSFPFRELGPSLHDCTLFSLKVAVYPVASQTVWIARWGSLLQLWKKHIITFICEKRHNWLKNYVQTSIFTCCKTNKKLKFKMPYCCQRDATILYCLWKSWSQ